MQNGYLNIHFYYEFHIIIYCMPTFKHRFAVSFIYYGITMNIGRFSGNLYSNYAISVTAEILGYSMCFLLDRTGRKPLHLVVLFGSSVACFLTLVPLLLLDECKCSL